PEPQTSIPAAATIAISRQEGANGSEIATALGQRLGWTVYDRALLDLLAQDMGLQKNLLESIDERGVNWLMGYFEGFSSRPGVSDGSYVYALSKLLLSLAAHGECVIVGRGAALFLPP